jgi:hypothetical protein
MGYLIPMIRMFGLRKTLMQFMRDLQERFGINVWAGIVLDQLIGPCVLPPRLTGAGYLYFLNNDLENLLEDVLLATRRNT